jgi:hypothetical protein
MILADTVRLLTTMGPTALTQVLKHSGFKDHSFKTAEFVGITNGGEFAYKVEHQAETAAGRTVDKVFVRYDQRNHAITAGF